MGTVAHNDFVGASVHASKEAPNLILNGGLQKWSNGISSQPDGFLDEGTPTVGRVDRSGGLAENDNWFDTPYAIIYQATGAGNEGGKIVLDKLKPNTVYSVHVRTRSGSVDSIMRLFTTGAASNLSTEIVSFGAWISLFGAFTTDSTPSDVSVKFVAKNSGNAGYFHSIMIVEGNVIPTFAPHLSDLEVDVSGDTIEKTFTETAHGFAVKDVVRFDGTNWVKAQADSAANSESPWVVKSVATDTFVAVWSGYISGLSGLTAGTVYFLDDDTAGLLTTTEPTDINDVSKPMLIALSTTTGTVLNQRGMVVTGGTTYWDEIRDADNDTGIRAEESADEDKLRFRTAGGERMQIDETGAIFMPDVYSDTVSSTRDLEIQSDGKIGYVFSSIKHKKNVRDLINEDTSWIHSLRVVKWDSKDGLLIDEIGGIAEETCLVNPKIVSFKRTIGEDGEISHDSTQPETIVKSRLIFPILKEVQKMREDLDAYINR